jgi:hypothetical protein
MVVTGRTASRLLRDVLSSDEQGRLLLRTGIAGAAIESPHGPAYEESDIQALRLRPLVDERELARVCPHGLWVCRLPRSAELAGLRITEWGRLPFVSTAWVTSCSPGTSSG